LRASNLRRELAEETRPVLQKQHENNQDQEAIAYRLQFRNIADSSDDQDGDKPENEIVRAREIPRK
jgi:hypothetical protein